MILKVKENLGNMASEKSQRLERLQEFSTEEKGDCDF